MKNNPIIQGRWYKINKKVKKRIKAKYHKIKDWVMEFEFPWNFRKNKSKRALS